MNWPGKKWRERGTKKGVKHMQKAGENASPGYEVRKSDDNDDNDDQIIVVVVIQDEKFWQFTKYFIV